MSTVRKSQGKQVANSHTFCCCCKPWVIYNRAEAVWSRSRGKQIEGLIPLMFSSGVAENILAQNNHNSIGVMCVLIVF